MIFHILRALFVLLMAAVGWSYFTRLPPALGAGTWLWIVCAMMIGVLFVTLDIFAPRRKLTILSGAFFGLLVGVAIAFALGFVVRLLIEAYYQPSLAIRPDDLPLFYLSRETLIKFITMLIGVVSCYLAISFILQTKDDFRFIIPYVEFSKQTKGARPILLDTSVLIDGRITDIAHTGIFESTLIVPAFVLEELQAVADSGEKLKRNRGRRGLDVLAELRNEPRVEVVLYDAMPGTEGAAAAAAAVDHKLMHLAKDLKARVLSNDYNLNKVAKLSGVDMININDLANALKPVILPGEKLSVFINRAGEEPGQGIGYLADGTMVVVEQAVRYQNEDVEFTVSRVLQTSAGRMVFGRLSDVPVMPGK